MPIIYDELMQAKSTGMETRYTDRETMLGALAAYLPDRAAGRVRDLPSVDQVALSIVEGMEGDIVQDAMRGDRQPRRR